MGTKGPEHPFAGPALYVVGIAVLIFLVGRATHTSPYRLAQRASDAISGMLGGPDGAVRRAGDALDGLRVAPAGPAHGYRPAAFGSAGTAHGDGCTGRDAVLARDLTGVHRSTSCTVRSGTLHDPYDGRTVHYRAGDPGTVRVDHVVALRTAWRSGAADWPAARRRAFAGDHRELLAVGARARRDRAGRSPAHWRPAAGLRCDYAERYVTVLHAYHLTVTRADKHALHAMLGTCG